VIFFKSENSMETAIKYEKSLQKFNSILVVEESSALRDMIFMILECKDYHITTATSLDEAIEEMTTKDFNLVIADLNGGEFNEIAVIEKTKELNPKAMLIIIVADHDVILPVEDLKVDVCDYLVKPFKLAELLERVSHCMGKVVSQRNKIDSSIQ
jgi:DNA-binding response OmpR family regulator